MHTSLRYCIVFALSLLVPLTAGASDWQTDYEKALAAARTEGKAVLLDFTGSDWCGPCIALKKNVFSQPEFKSYADKSLVLVEVDYPRTKALPDAVKQQNERLKSQYGIDKKGFPTIVLLAADGKMLGEFTGYDDEGPAEFIARLEKMRKGEKQ